MEIVRKFFMNRVMALSVCAGLAAGMPQLSYAQNYRDAEDMGQMVVTGTRTERTLDEVPIKTEVVDQQDMSVLGARTLADAIEFTNGVYIENDCQNCNFSQIRMQGLEAGYTQVLTNGQPTMSSLSSVYGIEQIPAALVERIEIVKGGASTLYGSGAVAGVVNVIPREPKKTGGFLKQSLEVYEGDFPANRMTSGAVDVVSPDKTYGITFFGQADYLQPHDINGDGYTELGKRDFYSGGLRAFGYVGDGGKLTFDYIQSHEDRRGGDSVKTEPETLANVAESIVSDNYIPSLVWTHEVNDQWDYRLSTSYSKTERDSYYGAGMDPNAYGTAESEIFIYEGQVNYNWEEDHVFSFGVQRTSDELTDEQPAYSRSINQKIHDTGLFVQHEWDITEQLNFLYGLRFDNNSAVSDDIYSPRAGIRYDPTDELTLRAAYSTGFRAPQTFDEDLHITQSGGEAQVISNASDLEEEKSQSYSFGAEWRPEDNLFLSGDVFYTDIDDAFVVEYTSTVGSVDNYTRSNQGGSKVYGAELNVGYQWERVKLEAGYGILTAEYDDPESDFNQKDYFRTPEDYGLVKVTVDADWADFFVAGRYIGEMKVPYLTGEVNQELRTSDRFFPVDIGMSKEVMDDVTFQIGVKNVFDDYQDDLDSGSERDAGYVYGPRNPRTFYTSMEWKF